MKPQALFPFHVKIALLGLTMGTFFPVVSLMLDLWLHHLPFTLNNAIYILRNNPIQWIILSAPLVLGTTFYSLAKIIKKREKELLSYTQNESKQIALIEQFFKKLETGEKLSGIEGLSNQALAQTIEHALHQMHQNKENEKRRQWTASGMLQLAEVYRDQNDALKPLCDKAITTLVHHLDAQQGTIFVRNEENGETYLEMISTYAYGGIVERQQKIHPGEGMLGQVFEDRETRILTQVPDVYVINSGLGNAKANSVALIPLVYNHNVYGVIEIASFKTLEAYQKEFLDRTAESLAVNVYRMQNVDHTLRMLKAAKEQEEQMKQQEEIMTKHIEELTLSQETQQKLTKELRSKEITLHARLDEALRVNEQLFAMVESLLSDPKSFNMPVNMMELKDSIRSQRTYIDKAFQNMGKK